MTVNILFSNESGGNSLSDNVDLGEVNPSADSTIQNLFIRHDAQAAAISDCAFYITRYTGSGYLGQDEDRDLVEVIGWGDDATGGFTINQKVPPTWSGEAFDPLYDQVFKSTLGTINNQAQLLTTAESIGSFTSDGEIPVNGEAHIQVRVAVAASVPLGANYRAVELVMAYSATS